MYKSVPLYTTAFTLPRYFKKWFPLEVDGKRKIIAYGLNYIAHIKDKWHSQKKIKNHNYYTDSESLIAFE